MFYYMLVQLQAYYMILHAFTVDSMQFQALHANPAGPADFKIGWFGGRGQDRMMQIRASSTCNGR